jgi:hypothetical protein
VLYKTAFNRQKIQEKISGRKEKIKRLKEDPGNKRKRSSG